MTSTLTNRKKKKINITAATPQQPKAKKKPKLDVQQQHQYSEDDSNTTEESGALGLREKSVIYLKEILKEVEECCDNTDIYSTHNLKVNNKPSDKHITFVGLYPTTVKPRSSKTIKDLF